MNITVDMRKENPFLVVAKHYAKTTYKEFLLADRIRDNSFTERCEADKCFRTYLLAERMIETYIRLGIWADGIKWLDEMKTKVSVAIVKTTITTKG